MRFSRRPRLKGPPKKTQEVFEYLKSRALTGDAPSYGEVGKQVGLIPLAVRYPLFYIWQNCERKGLPHLNAICVNCRTGRPGKGYTIIGDDWRHMKSKVFAHDWTTVTWDLLRQ
jgi:hypothetical protein